jgi:hypothetical protein
MAVYVAARVGAKAGRNEVLVSGTVKDLVLGSELDLTERGVHALKGVPGEWRLFNVSNDGQVPNSPGSALSTKTSPGVTDRAVRRLVRTAPGLARASARALRRRAPDSD